AALEGEKVARVQARVRNLDGLLASHCVQFSAVFDAVLAALDFPVSEPPDLDERILRVAHHLKTDSSEKVRVADLAELAGLSEVRLMHLFKQQMGLPIRRYHLWVRVRRAAHALQDG